MARIQVLPLAPQALGAARRTPFLLIIDQAGGGEFVDLPALGEFAEQAGAETIVVTPHTLDVT